MDGTNYCGSKIDWNYAQQYIDILMPGYVVKALTKFQHQAPKKPQYAPHVWILPTYGQKVQYALPENSLPILD